LKATNIALSTGSLNSEMSEDTYRRAQEEHFKKKKRREKKRKSIKRTSIKKKHHQAADGKIRSYSESHNLKKKKKGFIRTATMNLIGRNKGKHLEKINNKQLSKVGTSLFSRYFV